jgi:fermentation-respiration switch protein FrsA (DUF1100 family)
MIRFVVLFFCVVFVMSGHGGVARASDPAFYQVTPLDVAGAPGTLVRTEPIAAPAGASAAYRILYRSRDQQGRPVLVSGVAAIPATPVAKAGRPVVSWAHGTTGVATRCAPSRQASVFGQIEGLQSLLAAGAIVVATDYDGLGVASRPSYLVAVSEAHAVIDAVRAARRLPSAQAGRLFASWGWSQGAHAALAVAAVASRYAPELTLVGVAAAAPPTDLGALLSDDIGTPAGQVIASYAIWSWSHAYGVSEASAVVPTAQATVVSISGMCSRNWWEEAGLGLAALSDEAGLLVKNAALLPPWRALVADNSIKSIRAGVPVFIAQGLRDTIISPDVTRAYVRTVCRSGARVTYVEYAMADHGQTEKSSAPAAIAWLLKRFMGASPPSDCTKLKTSGADAA